MIYLTSDLHFHHKRIIEICNRPFSSLEEMHDKLIENWNNKVTEKDTVYVLGDFSFGTYEETMPIFNKLKGNIILVKGNHDSKDIIKLPWGSIHDLHSFNYNKHHYVLCHYPMRTWNKSFYGARHFFGHAHGTLSPNGLSCDVGVDCWNYSPVSIDDLEKVISTLNRNFIGQPMPKGHIWNGARQMEYGYYDLFVGDGSQDNHQTETMS